jgi:hypothetical protein
MNLMEEKARAVHRAALAAQSCGACFRLGTIFQHDRRGCRIGYRNVIVAMHFGGVRVHCASHRHPIQKLDSLRARCLDPIMN